MCDVSIVVPVYNTEKYLRRTVKALLTQKDISYEIILVNDGSSDNSANICKNICTENPNVRFVNVENGGPGRARNIGICMSKGKYICFCDSDDIPSDNMYGILYNAVSTNDCDYCMCDFYSERNHCNFGFPWKGDRFFAENEVKSILVASMLGNEDDDIQAAPVWGSAIRAIYKKDVLERFDVRFPEDIYFAEDLVFNIRYLLHCSSCYVLDQCLYRYIFNSDSLMNNYVKYYEHRFKERLSLVDYLKDAIAPFDETGELSKRVFNSARCYFHDCIGNAARAVPLFGNKYAYLEMVHIVQHPVVCEAFSKANARKLKKRLLYGLIRKKCTVLLFLYYRVRLK